MQWQSTSFHSDNDTHKFRKLMGIKEDEGGEANQDEELTKLSEEQKKKQDELFSSLDRQYEAARVTTHTQRGVGFGFGSQQQYHQPQPQPPPP
jgi:hypothetical protein